MGSAADLLFCQKNVPDFDKTLFAFDADFVRLHDTNWCSACMIPINYRQAGKKSFPTIFF